MPERCIAANCGKTHKDKVSLFKFPSLENDSQRYNEWVRQVKRTRDKWSGPTKNSRLCSAHFTDDQFEQSPKMKMSFGITVYFPRLLKPDALPTIFKRSDRAETSTSGKIIETVVQKLHRKRIIAALLQEEIPTNSISDTGTDVKEDISMEST